MAGTGASDCVDTLVERKKTGLVLTGKPAEHSAESLSLRVTRINATPSPESSTRGRRRGRVSGRRLSPCRREGPHPGVHDAFRLIKLSPTVSASNCIRL